MERKWEVEEVGLWQGGQIPDYTPFHLLILMGGPMSVNDEALYPFLKDEKIFLRRWIEERKPSVGICLGAQLIAHCLDGKVYRGNKEELGWYELTLTKEGQNDPFLQSFPARFPVFQWHSETFGLPHEAVLLATSQYYPHQAFRFGALTYAFQFHLEVTQDMIQKWLSDSTVEDAKKRRILSSLHLHLASISQLCREFMGPFLQAIELQAAQKA